MNNMLNPYTSAAQQLAPALVPAVTGVKYDAIRFAIEAARAGACRGVALIETAREIEAYLNEAQK